MLHQAINLESGSGHTLPSVRTVRSSGMDIATFASSANQRPVPMQRGFYEGLARSRLQFITFYARYHD
jgi:hypothetical protein